MQAELGKLNSRQQRALRRLFAGRVASALHVDAATSRVTVEFGPSHHVLMLGPRGGVIFHEIQKTWAATAAAHEEN